MLTISPDILSDLFIILGVWISVKDGPCACMFETNVTLGKTFN